MNDKEENLMEKEDRVVCYRKLCEENKLTINILIQRLLAHEKGRE